MSETAIRAEGVSKQYRLGQVGTGTISHDLNRWWHRVRGKDDPYLKVGEANDRAAKGGSDYVWALKDVSFDIKAGEAVGIIGRNGAGKSTLLKVLSKVTKPTTGRIGVQGRIASLLEVGTGFHPELSGRENIYLNGAILGMTRAEIKSKFDEIVDFAGVERYIDTPVKRYSSGMYVRLAFGVAAHLEPEILIVDEVLAVGDLEFQKKAVGKMKDVSESGGRTVLFVSHSMSAIRNLCRSCILMEQGQIAVQGPVEDTVGAYMSSYSKDNTRSVMQVTDGVRLSDFSREIEFVSFEFENPHEANQYATTEDIAIIITLKAVKTFSAYRLSFSIMNSDETNVGVFFSDESLSIKAGEAKQVRLVIKNHQLAKGQYWLDFSVGIGSHAKGIKDYDIIPKTLFFEITYTNNDREEMIALWHPNWGKINFQDVELTSL